MHGRLSLTEKKLHVTKALHLFDITWTEAYTQHIKFSDESASPCIAHLTPNEMSTLCKSSNDCLDLTTSQTDNTGMQLRTIPERLPSRHPASIGTWVFEYVARLSVGS